MNFPSHANVNKIFPLVFIYWHLTIQGKPQKSASHLESLKELSLPCLSTPWPCLSRRSEEPLAHVPSPHTSGPWFISAAYLTSIMFVFISKGFLLWKAILSRLCSVHLYSYKDGSRLSEVLLSISGVAWCLLRHSVNLSFKVCSTDRW